MRSFGLIGFPLGHSFSVGYFMRKFKEESIVDSRYDAYPLENIHEFRNLLHSKPDLKGLNVTIPYKEAILPYLDEIEPIAQKIGAINTIRISPGKLKGYNTDWIGFKNSLLPIIRKAEKRELRALILGTGGSSKAVAYVLGQLEIPFHFLSRTQGTNSLEYNEVEKGTISNHLLIINCSPIGMAPHLDSCPNINYEEIGCHHILFDLIYNPSETLFLKKGKEAGAKIKNGLEMLHIQAEASWDLWNEKLN